MASGASEKRTRYAMPAACWEQPAAKYLEPAEPATPISRPIRLRGRGSEGALAQVVAENETEASRAEEDQRTG
jgi:hypothetical protein